MEPLAAVVENRPAELQGQLAGYEALGIRSARGFGLFLAVIAAAAVAVMGYSDFGRSDSVYAEYRMVEAPVFLLLGWLQFRGNRTAMLSLMALYTADRIAGHFLSYAFSYSYYSYYTGHLAAWLCVGVAA